MKRALVILDFFILGFMAVLTIAAVFDERFDAALFWLVLALWNSHRIEKR